MRQCDILNCQTAEDPHVEWSATVSSLTKANPRPIFQGVV